MRRLHVLSTILCAATISVAAHADTVFSVTAASFKPVGANPPAVTLSGTVAENGTSFTTSNLVATKGGLSYSFTSGASTQGVDAAGGYFVDFTDAGGDLLALDFSASSLAGFTGGQICTTTSISPSCSPSFFMISGAATSTAFASGALTATPEPSSLALLGTGILGVVGAIRRRISRKA